MKRILEILPTLGYGGIATMVLNYYRALNRSVFKIDFVTHGGVEDYHGQIIKEGSNIYYLGTIKKEGLFNYFRKLKKIIIEGNYDAVHFHSCGIRLLILPFLKKQGIKIIIHSHSNKKGRFPSFFWKYLSCKYGNELLACSKGAGAVAYGKHNFTIIPNAIDFSKYNNLNRHDLDEYVANFKKNGKICLMHIGAFIKQKNQDFLIDVASKLKNKQFNFSMYLVGEGPLREKIEKRIISEGLSEYVYILGKRNDVNKLLNVADVFLLPSVYEGLPLVGVEAQSTMCPCLFSNKITTEVVVESNLCTFLPLKTDTWVGKIVQMSMNPESFKRRKYNIDKSIFNIEVSKGVLEQIYEKKSC